MQYLRLVSGVVFLFTFPKFCTATPIDNGIEAQPQIVCQQDAMRLLFNTQKPFHGHVYVKGLFRSRECHADLTRSASPSRRAVFEIPYRPCSATRERSLRPAGLSYTTVVIVQFHHLFLTKVDRAYRLTCYLSTSLISDENACGVFYMEASKDVSHGIRVSMIPTTDIFDTKPMPVCTYTVLANDINGPIVRYAKVGDKVVHKFSCENGIHGMLVHSCVARDGAGTQYQLVDKRGCAVDPIALGDLSYSGELTTAWVQVHVFKFADQMIVNFQCQITLCIKRDNGCEGITPPVCAGTNAYDREPLPVQDRYPATVPPPVQRPYQPAIRTFPPDPPFVGDARRIPIFPPPGPFPSVSRPRYDGLGQRIGSGYGAPSPAFESRPPAAVRPFKLSNTPNALSIKDSLEALAPAPRLPAFEGAEEPSKVGDFEKLFVPVPSTYRPLTQLRSVETRDLSNKRERLDGNTFDITSGELLVFNIDDTIPRQLDLSRNASSSNVEATREGSVQELCLGPATLVQVLLAVMLFFCSLMAVLIFCVRRHYIQRMLAMSKDTYCRQ